jgi:hypothetical protein
MSKVSSAYGTIENSPPKSSLSGWLIVPFCQALLITVCNKSAARTKRRGDKGSPCLTPLKQLKVFPGIPFNNTAECPELRMLWIHPIHYSENPLCLITSKITWCSSLSKAFSISNLRTITFFLDLWHKCRNWNAHARQSWMVLPLMKPYWFWCTSCRISDCKLVDRSFVMHEAVI